MIATPGDPQYYTEVVMLVGKGMQILCICLSSLSIGMGATCEL